MSDKIIDRIRKLLKLAGNAGSEQEAALAAQRAAEMMAEHEIHEAQVSLDAPTTPRVVEPIEKCYRVTNTNKRVAWHMRVCSAVAKSYGACAYWTGGSIVMFGRLSAVQAAGYTSQYLMQEIIALADKQAPTHSYSRSYRNAFRLGAANRVGHRVEIEADKADRARKRAEHVVHTPAPEAERVEIDRDSLPPTTTALALIESDRAEVQDAYKEYSSKWRSGRSIGHTSSGDGYRAGKAAADSIKLGGKRGALPRGQGVLK